jgi:hypothetical protein
MWSPPNLSTNNPFGNALKHTYGGHLNQAPPFKQSVHKRRRGVVNKRRGEGWLFGRQGRQS